MRVAAALVLPLALSACLEPRVVEVEKIVEVEKRIEVAYFVDGGYTPKPKEIPVRDAYKELQQRIRKAESMYGCEEMPKIY